MNKLFWRWGLQPTLCSDSPFSAELSSSMLEYIQHLERILSTGNGDLTFSAFEPMIQYVLPILGGLWLHYVRHEVTTFLEWVPRCPILNFLKIKCMHFMTRDVSKIRRLQDYKLSLYVILCRQWPNPNVFAMLMKILRVHESNQLHETSIIPLAKRKLITNNL